MLTMKSRYAIRALTALAAFPAGELVLTRDVAKNEDIPQRFLEGIFLELRQHGILNSRKGRGGGYSLSLHPRDITVAAVVTALDGPIASEPCVNPQVRRSCRECENYADCGIRVVLERVYSGVVQTLEAVTIAELAGYGRRDLNARLDHVLTHS
jgi:Rrf2 family protein